MNKYDIVTLGEILIDYTSVGNSNSGNRLFMQNAGGAPANVAVCATKLGRKCAFVGKVGNDMQGRFLVDTLNQAGVDTSGVVVDSCHFTTLAFVDIAPSGERTFSFARSHGADTMLTIDELDNNMLTNCAVLHVGSLSLTTQLGENTTMHAVTTAKNANAIISYDPNYRASLWDSKAHASISMASMLPLSNVVKISDEECMILTGSSSEVESAHNIAKLGAHVVCVTLGSRGAYLYVGGVGQYVDGFAPTSVVDTTGAGDSFWGAVLSHISTIDKPLTSLTIDELVPIVKFANATASLCIEGTGAIPSMPTMSEVKARLAIANK